MSGGAFDYFYLRLEDVADQIYREVSDEEKTLAELLRDLAKTLKALEWWKSGDTDFEDFKEEFDKFRAKWLKT